MRKHSAIAVNVALLACLLGACGEAKSLSSATTTTIVNPGLTPTLPTTTSPATSTTVAAETTVATTVPFRFTETTLPPTLPPTVPPTLPAPAPTLPPLTVPPLTAPIATAPPITIAPTTTVSPVVNPIGSVTNLQPDAATITTVDAETICALDAAQYTTEQCLQAPSFNNDMTVLIQRHVGDQLYRVVVMFKKATSPVHYESSYIAHEPAVGAWAAVHAEVSDHNGDTFGEVWIGYRYAGTGGYLDLDILDPRATGSFFLGGLRELPKGRIDTRTGGADVISAADVDATPFLVQAIGYSGMQWRVNSGTLFPLASAPPIVSDFP